MLKLTLVLYLLTILIPATASAGPKDADLAKSFKPDDLHRLRSVSQARISPDGKKILYTVTSREGMRSTSSQIMVWDVSARETAPLLQEGQKGSNPRWSPDGRWIAYLGSRDDQRGLMVVRADGSSGRFLASIASTNHPLPSSGERITWSPDGQSIAFVSATPGPESEEANGDPRVITRYLYKPSKGEGMTRFNDNKRTHIFVVDVEGRQVRQITDGSYYEHSIDWSPDGEEILFVSNREPDPDRFFNYDLFAIKVADGTLRRITRTENAEYRPRWSPDGKSIAYEGTKRGLTSSETTMEDTHVWLVNADGSDRRELGAAIDNRQRSPVWAVDGSGVFCTVQERGSLLLYRLPISGGKPEVVIRDLGGRTSYSVADDDLIAFSTSTRSDMAQLFLKRGTGEPERLTDLNRELMASREVAKVEAFTFLSFDGREVEAFLTHPLGKTRGSKHPMIATIKGGPHGQNGPYFDHRAQVYAARGYASLKVNYRGSTGYGQAFADAIFGDQNGGEAKDVLYAVDAALRRNGWIDPERLGIEGGSYGGQLSMWLVTQTDRFKAAIPRYGICNLISFNYMAYYHDYLAVEFGAFPHQDNMMDFLWERSALKHVASVKTPVMLVHGENDNDVPIAESEQFYIALKDVGVEAVMVRYPREGHGVREIGHQVDLVKRSIDWYEKHFHSRN
jgi:dipeptidyl aminopeptidase/acylaminoacyl peptidase